MHQGDGVRMENQGQRSSQPVSADTGVKEFNLLVSFTKKTTFWIMAAEIIDITLKLMFTSR